MSTLSIPVLLSLVAISAVASVVVLLSIDVILPFVRRSGTREAQTPRSNSFLFHEGVLVDHDVRAPDAHEIDLMHDWSDLRAWLKVRFPDLPKSLTDISQMISVPSVAQSDHASSTLTIAPCQDNTRVTLTDAACPTPAAWHTTCSLAQTTRDVQHVLDHAPCPIWKTDAGGGVIWRNASSSPIIGAWQALPKDKQDQPHLRLAIPLPNKREEDWFEITSHRDAEQDTVLHYATCINAVIEAENASRDFVQTLTKTFANLTTGLAVFDRSRCLQLFNPALVDLTGLPVDFLSAQPDVIRFFDQLRERQVLPEPRNYASLRTQIRDMIEQASDGVYVETWSLPTGTTYRVTGRPHPNGAVAFLFEDISAEIMKTRQFRSQIDLGQAVIDGLEEAILVLAPNNVVMLCNSACTRLLGIDPANSFADMSLNDLIKACRQTLQKNNAWSRFESALKTGDEIRSTPNCTLSAHNGQDLTYRITALPGGVRLISFQTVSVAPASVAITAAQ